MSILRRRIPRFGAARRCAAAAALLFLAAAFAAADTDTTEVRGTVVDRTGEPVQDASVAVGDGWPEVETGADGAFSVQLAPGRYVLWTRHPAYRTARRDLVVGAAGASVRIELRPPLSATESITVTAIRAGDEAPVTTTNIDREELADRSHGQDVPAVIEMTPSVTWYSDSGIGSNYSYFSLRGIQQGRINITLDGAPLNDPAEHALYFNNFHDVLSMVDSVQVQRGVGTSSVGSPSYGGSVNFASVPFSADPAGDVRLGIGSFDTQRASAAWQTGVLDSGLAFYGRVSASTTDGYRDHSGSDHHTVFFNAGWHGKRSQLKLVSFFGHEESQMAYLAVEPDVLRDQPRHNPLDEAERDSFDQDFAQLQYTLAVDDETTLAASLYANRADGEFLLWDDPVAQTELLSFGIDQSFVGAMATLSRTSGRLETTVGVHGNDFSGDHTLDTGSGRAYLNTGFKQQANAFVKLGYDLDRWYLFGDLQVRWAEFEYEGDVDLGSVDWTFVDPKVGVRYHVSPRLSAYASIGEAEREPARLDLLAGEDDATVIHDLNAVRPEQVVDLELGVDYSGPRLALQANLYAMEFDDEIALTGELSDIGLPLRRNVERSHRRGLEVDLRWRLAEEWTLINRSAFSSNEIAEWTQHLDVYGPDGEWLGTEPRTFTDVDPLLSPEVIVNQGIEYARGPVELALTGRYVSESYLDNTGTDSLQTPSYVSFDLRGSIGLGQWIGAGRPRLSVWIHNLLDEDDIYPSGYSYQWLEPRAGGGLVRRGTPYYYPRATRSIVLALDISL